MGVDVVVTDEVVVISFSGLERLLTLKSRIIVAVDSIRSARVASVDDVDDGTATRLLGTRLPGGPELWSVARDDEALVLELEAGDDQPYERIVLQHPDRHDLAWWIGERIPA